MDNAECKGFKAAGIVAGIKKNNQKDLGLIFSEVPARAAAVFTRNRVQAAPVVLDRERLQSGQCQAVIVNSGNANCCTGTQGLQDARAMTAAAARQLGIDEKLVMVASTGVIGNPLPLHKVEAAVPELVGSLTAEGFLDLARAIMTTDTVPKETLYRGGSFTVGGMAKGAGMVRPDMATMLVVVTTDAVVRPAQLREALQAAVDESFHALNIDGCPSTNDTVILLASGSSGVVPSPAELTTAVGRVCWDLANQLAADAEGASRVVTIDVVGAPDSATARRAGRLVCDSALVRSAFYGGDPNWGRLLGALGAGDIEFDPDEFGIAYEGVAVAEDGREVSHDPAALHAGIAEGDFTVTMTIGRGPGSARVLTTDLTPEYVNFNAEYS